jgi:hypothetical protein
VGSIFCEIRVAKRGLGGTQLALARTMFTRTSIFSALVSLTSFGTLAACSVGVAESPSAPTQAPEAPGGSCSAPTDCPNVVCSCANGDVVNARQCIQAACLGPQATCKDVCGGGTTTPTNPGMPTMPTTPAAASGNGDPCVPVSSSSIVPRVGAIEAQVASHQSVPSTPSNGSVNASRDSDNRVTYISYDAVGSASDYTDRMSYDSNGKMTYWNHDASGSTADVTERFSYDSDGHVTYWNHDADGSTADVTERFSYDSDGHLTYWNHDANGSIDDVTERFSYDSDGLVTYWNHDADGSTADVTERFSYDSSGRVTYWNYDGNGSNDATINASYGSTTTIRSDGARASGATVKACR